MRQNLACRLEQFKHFTSTQARTPQYGFYKIEICDVAFICSLTRTMQFTCSTYVQSIHHLLERRCAIILLYCLNDATTAYQRRLVHFTIACTQLNMCRGVCSLVDTSNTVRVFYTHQNSHFDQNYNSNEVHQLDNPSN